MAKSLTLLDRLTKGIITDKIGVRGALLEANDVVPLERGEGYRTRGGKAVVVVSASAGAAAWPTFTGGRHLWDLVGTVWVSPSTSHAVLMMGSTASGNRFGALSDDARGNALDYQALDEAGTAITLAGRTNAFGSTYGHGVLFGQELLIPGSSVDAVIGMRYAGNSNATASVPYSTGTVSGAAGSTTLTGSGTTFALAHLGAFIHINDADTEQRSYRIVRVTSATSIELDRPLGGAVAAATAYRITATAGWFCKPGTFGAFGHTATITTFSTVDAVGAAGHQGRVIVWDTVDADNFRYIDRARWSAPLNETDGHWGGAENFHPNAFLDIAPGEGGGGLIHGVSWRGAFYFFKPTGVYVLRGYLASDGSDEGATVELFAPYGRLVNAALPVAADEGVYFLTNDGLMLLNSNGVTNVSRETGTQELFDSFGGFSFLSVLKDRIILHKGQSLAAATAAGTPNVLVFDRRNGTWSTQTTFFTTRVLSPWTDAVGVQVGVARSEESAAIEGEFVEWHGDHEHASLIAEDGRYPLLAMTTHPVSIAGPGAVNGRVCGVQVKAKITDVDAVDPVLEGSVLLGEQGTTTAVEAAIAATADAEDSTQTEKWYRLPVRAGSPPVDQVRARVVQSGGSRDIRVTEVAVEHVPVRRFRS